MLLCLLVGSTKTALSFTVFVHKRDRRDGGLGVISVKWETLWLHMQTAVFAERVSGGQHSKCWTAWQEVEPMSPFQLPKSPKDLTWTELLANPISQPPPYTAVPPAPLKSPVLWQSHADSDPEAEGRGTANNPPSGNPELRHHSKTTTTAPAPRTPPITHRSQPTTSNLPLHHWILLFLSLLRPHPLSKQSNPGQKRWPLSKTHCFSFTPQAPSGFSSFSLFFIYPPPLLCICGYLLKICTIYLSTCCCSANMNSILRVTFCIFNS